MIERFTFFRFVLAVLCTANGFIACSNKSLFFNDDGLETKQTSVFIAVFGDIQYYTNIDQIDVYKRSLNWLQEKAENGWHFNCILHTGDVTMGNEVDQWKAFFRATNPIAQRIPFVTMIGDHDYTWEDGVHIDDRNSTHLNEYVQFPLTTEKIVAWFEQGRMENIVVENTIYGQRLDLLVLEFGPRKEVVEWADAYVKAHPDVHFILMNHEYLATGGKNRLEKLKCATRLRNTTYTTPEQLWNSLIKCNDNIRVVLCGHVQSLYSILIDENDYGRTIPQIQHNIQDSDYRSDNWLMLWEFPIESDSASVYIYNTKLHQYYNNMQSLFKFRYKDANTKQLFSVEE